MVTNLINIESENINLNAGVEIKCGSFSVSPNTHTTVKFNTPFKHDCLSIVLNGSGSSQTGLHVFKVSSCTKDFFQAYGVSIRDNLNPLYGYYIAIGY